MTTETFVTIAVMVFFVILFGGFMALWIWLMDGWFGSGWSLILVGLFVAFMFSVFGWLFIFVILALIAAAVGVIGTALQ